MGIVPVAPARRLTPDAQGSRQVLEGDGEPCRVRHPISCDWFHEGLEEQGSPPRLLTHYASAGSTFTVSATGAFSRNASANSTSTAAAALAGTSQMLRQS